ncbi:PQQ-binding-like beta-propeller repeat protein [Bradyrhizobium sp. vgs-9]|uniref:outer membrane protein assembly factor BamB family protein n=1 Tax=Bradyrhizobium sp. vgs-9 TaxID=208389 RepID=UPI0035D437E9
MKSFKMRAPAFRHDPAKLVVGEGAPAAVRWDKEPALFGYTRLTHFSERINRELMVPVCASPIILGTVGVLVCAYDGRVRLFNVDLSRVVWEQRLNAPIYATPLAAGPRALIVATTKGDVVAFAHDGSALWCSHVGRPVYATPTVVLSAGLAIFATFGSRCVGLDIDDGRIRFALDLPQPWSQALGGKAANRDPYASPVVTSRGDVIVCCAESVVCLAPEGTMRWRRDLDAAIRASPAALHESGEVAVATVNGCCFLLDAETGAIVHRMSVDSKIVASPAVSGSFVIFGATDGHAVCIHAPTRTVAWQRTLSSPKDYSSYSVTPCGDFISINSAGNVLCRGYEDGRFLWETSQLLGLGEHDPTLDTTPIVGNAGSLYSASYAGFAYYFRFQPAE